MQYDYVSVHAAQRYPPQYFSIPVPTLLVHLVGWRIGQATRN